MIFVELCLPSRWHFGSFFLRSSTRGLCFSLAELAQPVGSPAAQHPSASLLVERWSEDERPASGALPATSSRRKQAFLATVHNGPQPEPASLAASASLLAPAPISSSVAWPAPKTATSPLFSLMASQFPELLFLDSPSPCCYFFCPNQNFMEPCLPFVPCILGPHLSHFST